MNILAVDDEKIALEGLVLAIKKSQPDSVVKSFARAKDAMEFMRENPQDIVFLDIQMRGTNGIELAKQLKVLDPKINIVFTTGYGEYKGEAMDLRVSGYILKPITVEKITEEIENLRYPIKENPQHKIVVKTFGNFEVYIDDKPIEFQYSKTKEMFAYLVNRQGALCTNNEIMAILWEDEVKISYFKNVRVDLLKSLPKDMFVQQRGKIGIVTNKISCDYYDWIEGKVSAINAYTGEYMAQYSWGEFEIEHMSLN